MARSLSRRGRMRSDDERRIQINSLFIEHEVDAKDLAGALYANQIIDCNDRDEILGGCTRLERTRRMIDILLLRGHEAFDVFLRALDDFGYDHVASRLRTTEVMITPKPSLADLEPLLRGPPFGDLDPLIRNASALSFTGREPTLLSERLRSTEPTCLSLSALDPGGLSERLKNIEGLWDILSRRVTRIERKVEPATIATTTNTKEEGGAEGGSLTTTSLLGEEELQHIKKELAQIKADTLTQVQELTSSNIQKAAIIENLLGEVEEKTAQLQEAHCRIEELEQRIELLESEKAKSVQEVGNLRDELEQHREHVKHQEEWFNAENLRMKNKMIQQEKILTEQETKVTDLQEEKHHMRQMVGVQQEDLKEQRRLMETQQQDLKEQRRLMEEQSYQLGLLTKHIFTIANNNNNHNTSKGNIVTTDDTKPPETKAETRSRKHSFSGESDHAISARDLTVNDVNIISSDDTSANATKPHTAHPPAKNQSKNHFNNYYHRTSFNAGMNNNSINNNLNNNNSNSALSSSNTVSLHVPPAVNPAHLYRGSKRSAPAPSFRGYNRRK